MKLFLLIFFFYFFWTQHIQGQEENHLYLFDSQIRWINPSTLGINSTRKLELLIDSQWLGLKEAPKQQSLIFDASKSSEKLNTGGVIRARSRFGEQTIQVFLQSAYPLQINPKTKLFLGIQLLSEYFNSEYSLLRSIDGIANDPLLQQQRQFLPNIGIGFYLRKEKFWLQAAIPRLLDPSFITYQPPVYFQDKRYFFTALGGILSFVQFPYPIHVNASIHNLAYQPLTIQFQSSIAFRITEVLLGLNTSKNIGLGFQYKHQKFLSVGYFFQFPISTSTALHKTNHSIRLSFNLNPNLNNE